MNIRIVVNRTDDVERFVRELVEQFPQNVLQIDGIDGFPPKDNKIPRGKGMYAWRLDKVAGGNMALMAQQAKEAGFKWVSIKAVERGNLYNKERINAAVAELRAVGISARAWGYVYPDDVVNQAQKTAKIVNDLGFDGYDLDIEQEWKVGDLSIKATQYAQTLKTNLSAYVGIGLCSYRYPSLHPLPWKEFLAITDYHIPQVYWAGANLDNSPASQLKKSFDQLTALKNIPFVPLGIACGMPINNVMWYPTIAQLNNFSQSSATYPGYGYYEWTPAFERQDFWGAIKMQT